jgi:hypothetical protein
MAGQVDICNAALSHIGDEAAVTSVSPPDGSAQAAHCARFFPIALDELLEAHTWTFATVRATLALLSVTPPPNWLYAYAMPAQVVKKLAVLDPNLQDEALTEEYEVESLSDGTQVIYTNVQNATFRFIQRVQDTTKFTPGFVSALARLLAHYLAGPIIKGETGMAVAEAQLKLFGVALGNARTQDSNTGRRNTYRDRPSSTQLARTGAPPCGNGNAGTLYAGPGFGVL